MRSIFTAVAAAALSIALLVAVAALAGHPAAPMIDALVRGSFGSRYAVVLTITRSVPLLLTGLAVAVAFRAGIWNIGAEGQFIAGALAAYVAARAVPGIVAVPAALLAAVIAGAAWSSIASALRLWRNAPEVLTTILLNFVAIHLLGWAINGPLQEPARQYPQSDTIPAAAALPASGGIHAGVLLALAAAVAAWWLLFRTTEGLRLRATGANADAARWAGIDTDAQLLRAMAFSGGLAGLAGGIELLGTTQRLFDGFAAGYGYSGIAVALLADLHPLAAVVSALFFGALSSGAGELQRSSGISATIAVFGQAVVILAVVLFGTARWTGRRAAPAEETP